MYSKNSYTLEYMSYILTCKDGNDTDKAKPKYLGSDANIDIKIRRNHIYFYTEVNKKSAMELNIKLKDIEREIIDRYNAQNFHKEYIYLHINSYGGCIFSCLSIIDTINNLKVPIVSIVEGAAASAATLISIVCNHRLIHNNAYMLIHQLSSSYWGKMEQIEEEIKNLKELMDKIKQIYNKHSAINNQQIDEILKHDLWWNAEKCLKYGLVDNIIKTNKLFNFQQDLSEFDINK